MLVDCNKCTTDALTLDGYKHFLPSYVFSVEESSNNGRKKTSVHNK